jgi:hypothetical protein
MDSTDLLFLLTILASSIISLFCGIQIGEQRARQRLQKKINRIQHECKKIIGEIKASMNREISRAMISKRREQQSDILNAEVIE